MARPTYDNGPWSFDVNNDCSEATIEETSEHTMVGIKDSLVAHSAWAVVASSDSSSVKNIGDGTPDLWTDWATDIVRASAGSPHSWIIVENDTTKEQICIDMNNTNVNRCEVKYSATGSFSDDGTTSNRPTDTESATVMSNTVNPIDYSTDGAVVHTMVSNDDLTTRIGIYQKNGTSKGVWFMAFEEVRDPTDAWTDTLKRAFGCRYNLSTTLSTATTSQSPRMVDFEIGYYWRVYFNGVWYACYPSCECISGYAASSGDPVYKETNLTWNGNRIVQPIGLFREQIGTGGRIGKLEDMYYAPENHFVYDMYDATQQDWIKFGCVIVPWNNTTPLEIT